MNTHTEQVCNNHAEELLDKANVVGTVGNEKDGLLVFVTEKLPLEQLDARDVVPAQVEDVPTDVIQVGRLVPKIAPGASIGLSNAGTGTNGGPVRDRFGQIHLLTNNHVAADSNRARVLSTVHSPGAVDGLGKRIGTLGRFEPIYFDRDNYIDAALVRVDVPVTGMTSTRTATARVNWRVQKSGRTTGLTRGKIIGRNAVVDIDFGSQGVARFRDQLVTGDMLDAGDSGSVLTTRKGHPVGLCFAGSDGPEGISLHNPIGSVLRSLGVTFV